MSDEANEQGFANVREQTNERWLPIREASERLNLSERVLQKRAQRGEIASRKVKNRWEVLVCGTDPAEAPNERTPEHDSRTNERKRTNVRESNERGEPSPDTVLVAQLRSEVLFLRAELERRNEAESELRRLMLTDKQELLELRQQVAIGAAPQSETGEPLANDKQGAHKPTSGGWWQFWKRIQRY